MSEVQQDPRQLAFDDAARAIGGQLRQAREARGETVSDVALALKLTSRQVDAMEAGRLDVLPGAAFARGFLRNYARHVGFDPAALLAGLEPEQVSRPVELSPVSNAEGEMPIRAGVPRTVRLPAGLVGVALLVIAAGWYFDWFRVPGVDTPATETAPTLLSAPDAATPPADPPAPGEPQYIPAPMAPVVEGAAPAPVAPAVTERPSPEPSASAAPASVAAPQVTVAPAPAPAPAALPADGATAAQPATTGVEQLNFSFSGESWIEVRDASGSIVYSGVNAAGTRRTIQGRAPFALVIGNAREVNLQYRGQPYDLAPHIRVSVARLKVE